MVTVHVIIRNDLPGICFLWRRRHFQDSYSNFILSLSSAYMVLSSVIFLKFKLHLYIHTSYVLVMRKFIICYFAPWFSFYFSICSLLMSCLKTLCILYVNSWELFFNVLLPWPSQSYHFLFFKILQFNNLQFKLFIFNFIIISIIHALLKKYHSK